MEATELPPLHLDLTTPHVADAVMRLGMRVRQALVGVTPLWEEKHIVGGHSRHGTSAA